MPKGLGAPAEVSSVLLDARDRLTMGNLLRRNFLPDHPQRELLSRHYAETNDRLTALQRDMARPFPYHFEIRQQRNQPPAP